MVSLERCIGNLKDELRGVIMRSTGAWLTYHNTWPHIIHYWYSLRDVLYVIFVMYPYTVPG